MSWVGRMPWPAAATAAGASALVLLVAALPWTSGVLPFTGRIAELALAGSAAYLLDDAAATMTTVAPTGAWRRRAPVLSIGALLVASAWAVVLLALRWRDSAPPVVAASVGLLVLVLVALAMAAVLVRAGDCEPGGRVGPVVVLLGVGLLGLELAVRRPLFIPWDGDPRPGLLVAWVVTGLLAAVVALRASRDLAAR